MSEAEPLDQVLVRMPPDMHAAIKARAEADGMSMAEAVRTAVRQALGQPTHDFKVGDRVQSRISNRTGTVTETTRDTLTYQVDGSSQLVSMGAEHVLHLNGVPPA